MKQVVMVIAPRCFGTRSTSSRKRSWRRAGAEVVTASTSARARASASSG